MAVPRRLVSRARMFRDRLRSGPERRLAAELPALLEQGRTTEAVAIVRRELPRRSESTAFLREAATVAARSGELTLQIQIAKARVRVDPSPTAQQRLRRLAGTWRETTEGWLPDVGPTRTDGAGRLDASAPGRVLHLLKVSLPDRQSGYTMRAAYTLAAQRDAGDPVTAMTALDFPGDSRDGDPVPAREDVDGVEHLRLLRSVVPTPEPVDAYLDAWAAEALTRVASVRPTLLQVHSGHRGYEAALVGLALGRATGLPVVYEVRGFFDDLWGGRTGLEQAELTRRRRDTDTRCMLAADAVVTLSETMRDEITSRGVPADRIHVVPNGVDAATFAPREPRRDLAEQLGLSGRFVFGYVSNLDHPREGQELLVQAAVELHRRGVPATALIVGDGRRRDELEQLTRRLGATDVVRFTGRVTHEVVPDYYALLDVFVVPRQVERAAQLVTPLKPYEAMAAGRPLLVSDLAALREVVGNDRGRVFPAGDIDGLVAALLALHADPAGRAAMAARARDWVLRERQWAGNAARYRGVYEQVLSGPRRG